MIFFFSKRIGISLNHISLFFIKKTTKQHQKLTDLTNEFFGIIPHTNFSIEFMSALQAHNVTEWQQNLAHLTDVNFAFSLLLGAQHRMKGMCLFCFFSEISIFREIPRSP